MKKIIETVKKKLQTWRKQRAARQAAARQRSLDAEARSMVQVMEFAGDLYVSVNGIPLFAENVVSDDLATAVYEAREVYKIWKNKRLWEESETTGGSIHC